MAETAMDIHNGSLKMETCDARLDLIHVINTKSRWYNELVIQHSGPRRRLSVSRKDRNSVGYWFSSYNTLNAAEETDYIQHSEDLFAMVPKSKTPLRRFMEHLSHFRLFRLWMKASPVQDEDVYYTPDQRIDMLVNMVIALVGPIMFIVPLWGAGFRHLGCVSACDYYVLCRGVLVLCVVHDCCQAV
jgi:hypothetical protein